MFYVYVINFDDYSYYVGQRKCPKKYNPWNDPYMGSPKTNKNKWKTNNFTKTIIECYSSSNEALRAEKLLLEELNWKNDPYCLNACCGGTFSYEANQKGALTRNKLPVSKETREKQGKKSKERWSDPNWKHKDKILTTLREQSKIGAELVKNNPEIRAKISNALKGKYVGEKNSQYGTKLIYNLELKQTKRIGKNENIPEGWNVGAIYDFDKYFEKINKQNQKKEKYRLEKEQEKNKKIDFYTKWYEIYKINDFKTFCEITGYKKSQQNLCAKFKIFVECYEPKTKNGK